MLDEEGKDLLVVWVALNESRWVMRYPGVAAFSCCLQVFR